MFRYLISIFTAGSLERRFEFKEEHSCKPFSWFLENIYPEKFILDDPEHVFAYGRLKNPHSNTCLDNLQNDDKDRCCCDGSSGARRRTRAQDRLG